MSVTGSIMAAGSIGGGIFGAIGAGKQAKAADQAAQLSYQAQQNSLDFQKQVYGNTQQQLAPWLQTGTNAITRLNALMGLPQGTNTNSALGPNSPFAPTGGNAFAGTNFPNRIPSVGGTGGPMLNRLAMLDGGDMGFQNPDIGTFGGTTATGTGAQLSTPMSALGGDQPFQDWNQQFVAPTAATEQNDPGYQFRLQQGQQALENSAAARGGLLSGGTLKAEQQYGQDYASNEYSNVYNRALGQYQQNYNIFQNNQNTKFNRLAALSGIGQTSAGQLASAGQAASNSISNIFATGAQQQSQDTQNAAAARASGYSALGNAFGGTASNIGELYMLNQLKGLLGHG